MANTILAQTTIEQGAYHKEILLEVAIDTPGPIPDVVHNLGFVPTKIIANDCMCTDYGSLAGSARVFPQVRQAGGSGTANSFDADATVARFYATVIQNGGNIVYISVWVGLEHSISD